MGKNGPSRTARAEAHSPTVGADDTEDITQYWFFWELRYERELEKQLEPWGLLRALYLLSLKGLAF